MQWVYYQGPLCLLASIFNIILNVLDFQEKTDLVIFVYVGL